MDAGKVAASVVGTIPILGGIVSKIIQEKSAEKWFKSDLMEDLQGLGFSPAQLKQIKSYLNTGKDQDLTRKMQELIAANPQIADQLTQVISARASQNKVPGSSINQDMLANPPPSVSNFPESLPYYLRSEDAAKQPESPVLSENRRTGSGY